MENLNAEQVKRALECCNTIGGCKVCPYSCNGKPTDNGECGEKMSLAALALINSQEQRIKELGEENKAWQKRLISTEEKADKAYYDLACEVENLRAENERLRAIPEQMKERLQAYFGTYVLGYKIPLTEALKAVNQIAKEMLEGEK